MRSGNLKNNRVLVVDDQPEIHEDFKDTLRSKAQNSPTDALAAAFLEPKTQFTLPAFELLHARSGEEACKIVEKGQEQGSPVAVAYVDIRMPPGIDGVETVRRLRGVDRRLEVVIMTAYTDKPLADIIQDMELLHKLLYIRKPFAREEIQQITLALVEKWNVEREVEEARRRLTDGNRRLEAVLDSTGDAIAMYDRGGQLVFANRWYERLFDVPEPELRKIPRDAAAARFRKPAAAGPAGGAGTLRLPGDGRVVEHVGAGRAAEKRLFHCSEQPVHDADEEVIGDLVVYRDVSREIEIEQMKVEVRRLRSELEATYSFAGIVAGSPGMRNVCALIKQAIESDITVLIKGESGTGKELVARALHFNGPRSRKPFVAVNCAGVPDTLIESEMFGHERGAFTGATALKIGCFEQADGGTLLLDEVGDMPASLQATLLRVLQEREIRRVGGTATIPVDVHVIAATNKDLAAEMRAGAFREDLFYRIAAFPIVIPPLRERPEDVPLLAEHFLRKHRERLGKAVDGIAAGALRLLLQYAWPGNVRELENAVWRAVTLESTDMLQAESLPPELAPAAAVPGGRAAATAVEPLADLERRAIAHAIDVSANNLTRAARALGINRATLHRKLKKYGRQVRTRAST